MGGSSSRFEETDWNKADGKLTSQDQTIDNASPTSIYGVYYLTKLGVNQRDYDVTDRESNLLYSTRAVEGTLSWFDVLGQGIDEYLLRVQVDLSRRYWVVYRYGVPAFAGQVCSKTSRGRLEMPLYRKACITVTWARYYAVVDMYEPAPPTEENDEDYKDTTNDLVEEKRTDDEVSEHCAVIDGEVDGSVETESSALGSDTAQSAGGVDESKQETLNSPATKNVDVMAQSGPDKANSPTISRDANVKGTGQQNIIRRSSSLTASINWVKTKATATMENVSAPHLPANRDEGVITLDNPVLMVQEINSFTGQHQTMLIRKEDAQKLKDEEILIEAKLAEKSQVQAVEGETNCMDDEAIATNLEENESQMGTRDGGSAVIPDAAATKMAANSNISVVSGTCKDKAANGANDSTTSDTRLTASLSVEDKSGKNEESFMSDDSAANADSTTYYGSASNGGSATNNEVSDDEQPLVGFWSWDSRIRVHRMKMHVGAGADLALHVVLAVVTNQLRSERHAVAVAV